MTDILIKNGQIVDGSGNDSFKGNILIKDGIITDIADISYNESADLVIDAKKKVVCPGFIDVHSHYDFSYLADKSAKYSIMQGITTEIVGNCGLGLAPMNDIVAQYYKKYISFVLGSLEIKQFQSIKAYITHIAENGCSLNVGFLIPQGNVRACVLGMDDHYPTDTEFNEMRKIIRQEMKAGAFGMSTGLIYPPGSITTTEELIELNKVVGEFDGIYASHIRDEGRGVLDAIGEAIEIGRKGGTSIEISHVKVAGGLFTGGLVNKVLKLFEDARAEGLNVNGDIYPYTAGNSVLSALLKPWVFEGGQEAFQNNLSDPEKRERIITEFKDFIWEIINLPKFLRFLPRSLWMKLIMSMLKKRCIITSMMHQHEFEGLTLGETLKETYPDLDIYNATLNLLKDEDGAIIISMFLMKKKDVIKFMQSPYLMFSTDNLAPAAGNPHPRVLGTYPRILGQCVREMGLFTLEEAIWKMTGFPAEKFKLDDRGILKVNNKADIVIFDPDTVIDTATHQNPKSFPIGIDKVIVNGKIVVDDNTHTEELPGEVLKMK